MLMAVLLRIIVYFRDNYRASNYGIPDLIQVIRAIDAEIVRQRWEEQQDGLAAGFNSPSSATAWVVSLSPMPSVPCPTSLPCRSMP